MAKPVAASFLTQANALFKKNLTYQVWPNNIHVLSIYTWKKCNYILLPLLQKRNIWSNVRLIVIPLYLCVVLVCIQAVFDSLVNNSVDNQCGCRCADDDKNGDGKCEIKSCGLQYSSQNQAVFCAFPNPPPLLPLLHIPPSVNRDSCQRTGSCPVTILVTGNNQSLGTSIHTFPL